MKKINTFLLILISGLLLGLEITGPPGIDLYNYFSYNGNGLVYVSSVLNNVYKVNINLNTWEYLDIPYQNTEIRAIESKNNLIFVGRNGHLLKSINGGSTWEVAEDGITDDITPSVIKICDSDENIVLARLGLNIWYRSTNCGNSWTRLPLMWGNAISYDMHSDFVYDCVMKQLF